MAVRFPLRFTFLFAVLLAYPACTAFGQAVVTPPKAPAPGGCVVTVDGSGCLCNISKGLNSAIAACHLPLTVEVYSWSHGAGRVLSDLCMHGYQKTKGTELAAVLLAHREACPAGKLYLVCHSSGAAVALAATECLPPGCLDRIILLAPAVSAHYDLRPALRSSREGIDVFYSKKDFISYALMLTGTTDGYHEFSAGCRGFQTVGCCPEDQALYANLRQCAWEKCTCQAGHNGGHFGCTGAEFMSASVVPLLKSCALVLPK